MIIILYTRIIINIDILTNNQELYRLMENELLKLSIKKNTFAKNDSELFNIKETILSNTKDKIEWFNIERVGMKYIINIEPKVSSNKEEKQPYCHVISTKDALITRIITEEGIELKEINESVKKGDIIISGDIKLNDELKKEVCASGKVYGKTWYTINISLSKTYKEKTPLKKKRYNILLSYNNQKHLIFKSRLKTYLTNSKKLLSIFGLDIYLNQDIEAKEIEKEYTEKELQNKIDNLVKDKMSKILEGEYQILEQKVLKKQDNNSTIDIELFIVAEELISKTKITNPTKVE